ncbi:PrsW family glutamic-type intramembrane protease [Alicyclobacillus acidoterrestris]|uniref:Protease PrsW n=1 Tax=Alicyclobacillus acidoterrestris (strain ATCC 49025 / DSM 3922 / CIP 106132 / NCIMB 13137 / GD3B) TaxID=1356854 RepID=T0DBY6_ALIAG|nr:PrsW family glutamic-type intramembrane protease [Alicyclobacillus acidoterrestris]EPZ48887.1 hypothetical protein N007_03360 [Alicyclobacillus acidoterrestris ATCC 49025]UNO47425.1 PrsW family glutamic-type intramembrane protease [Alicyclobacillus acidoterrestris]
MFYVALAVIPGLLLLVFMYTRDQLHPEPKRQVFRLFILGAAIVFPAGVIERLMMGSRGFASGGIEGRLITAFFVAGMIEEFLKASIFDRTVYQSRLVRGPVDCIVYAAAVGLGFATVENVMYVTSSGLMTAIVRSVTAVPAHLMFAIIMGYWFAKAKFEGKSKWLAYVIPAATHGVYDTFALSSTVFMDLVLVAFLLFLVETSARIMARVRSARAFNRYAV